MRKDKIKRFQKVIFNWYKQNKRYLPWRNTSDPYKILIAEFLLQKTDVEKVKAVYEQFINHWPTIQLLCEANIHAIAEVIQPLGLKYKATRLKSVASIIVDKFNGNIPQTTKMLLELPGVGRYIASTIECFAYNKPTAILDTNVIRILTRVLGVSSQKQRPRDDTHLWDLADELLPHKNIKDYNWALLDYGSLICRSRRPLCNVCTLQEICTFYQSNIVDVKG